MTNYDREGKTEELVQTEEPDCPTVQQYFLHIFHTGARMRSTKRDDIQGVRGLAIAAVIAFHLNENAFPAGFVGVDIFFVLSGYLMTVILSKEKILDKSVFINFYKRRFKRIVPLYAILLAVLAFLVPCFLLLRDVVKFCQDVVRAGAFATNVHSAFSEKDYFEELYDSNVLTHTWSLGVEIQYYLIVPFIIVIQRKLSEQCGYSPFLPALMIASFVFQQLSSPGIAFNLLPSRVWQFLAGALSHETFSVSLMSIMPTLNISQYQRLSTNDKADMENLGADEEEDQTLLFTRALWTLTTDLITFVLIAVSFTPWIILPSSSLRFIVVLLTSTLLVAGCDQRRQGILLTNRFVVYLGDLSYVVYLAHWSVIIMWKSFTDSSSLSINGIIICLTITFAISLCTHHTIEQYFIRAKGKATFVVVSLLYVILAIALVLKLPVQMSMALKPQAASTEITEAIEFNEHVAHFSYGKYRPFKECLDDPEGQRMRGGYKGYDPFECVWTPSNSTGSLQILVIGNSISHFAVMILKRIIEENFPEVSLMRLFSRPACIPLEFKRDVCPKYFQAIPDQVQGMKPDITFIIYNESNRLLWSLKNARTDKAVRDFTAFLKPIANASRFVILDEYYPKPTTPTGMGVTLQKRLLRNQTLTDLKGSVKSYNKKYASYFARLDQLKFPNLIRHNTSAAMCAEEPGWCWWYNRKNMRSYFTDNIHLSLEGLELIRESYTKILQSVIANLE